MVALAGKEVHVLVLFTKNLCSWEKGGGWGNDCHFALLASLPPLEGYCPTHCFIYISRKGTHLAMNGVTSEPMVQLAFTDDICQTLCPLYVPQCCGWREHWESSALWVFLCACYCPVALLFSYRHMHGVCQG